VAGDFVSLSTELLYDSTGFFASEVHTSAPDPLSFVIDIHVGAPAPEEIVLPIITSEVVVAGLGNLPAGDYSYVVNMILEPRTTGLMIHADSFSGSFTVAPEPSALALLGLALAALAFRSQIRAR
jgi:hypothetical protein